MEAFETMFANGDKLSMESLKGFEGAGFGHGQDPGEGWRMAITSGWVLPNLLLSLRWLGYGCRATVEVEKGGHSTFELLSIKIGDLEA